MASLHTRNHAHQEQWESDDGVHESDADIPHSKGADAAESDDSGDATIRVECHACGDGTLCTVTLAMPPSTDGVKGKGKGKGKGKCKGKGGAKSGKAHVVRQSFGVWDHCPPCHHHPRTTATIVAITVAAADAPPHPLSMTN